MEIYNPAHPGELIREACLKPTGLTVTAARRGLGDAQGAIRSVERP
jgi:plasmid maintenance system antidote protein VapI